MKLKGTEDRAPDNLKYRPLAWSRMQSRVLNGKVGRLTLFTVAYHTGENRFFVSPKLPGLKPSPVGSETQGMRVAEETYHRYLNYLLGEGQ